MYCRGRRPRSRLPGSLRQYSVLPQAALKNVVCGLSVGGGLLVAGMGSPPW